MGPAIIGLVGVLIGAVITSAFAFWRFYEERRMSCLQARRDEIRAVQDALYTTTHELMGVNLAWDLAGQRVDGHVKNQTLAMTIALNRMTTLNRRLLSSVATERGTRYAGKVQGAADLVMKMRSADVVGHYFPALEAVRVAQNDLDDELMRLYQEAGVSCPVPLMSNIRASIRHFFRRGNAPAPESKDESA